MNIKYVTDKSIWVSYFKKPSKDFTRWNFLEEEIVQETFLDQVLGSVDEITYQNGNIIRCKLT